jgi:hypothetical protein
MGLDVENYKRNSQAKAVMTAPALGMTMLERYIEREQWFTNIGANLMGDGSICQEPNIKIVKK